MFNIGDLIERITWDAQARKMGVVVALGTDYNTDEYSCERLVAVCWQGSVSEWRWARPTKLKLIARGKRNV